MKVLLIGILLIGTVAVTGCAGVEATVQHDLSVLSDFTAADLDAALTLATVSNDQAAINCWKTLLGIVKAGPITLPPIKGVASAIQARRDITNGSGVNSMAKQVNVGCASLFVSETFTLARLAGKAGVGLPIPLP